MKAGDPAGVGRRYGWVQACGVHDPGRQRRVRRPIIDLIIAPWPTLRSSRCRLPSAHTLPALPPAPAGALWCSHPTSPAEPGATSGAWHRSSPARVGHTRQRWLAAPSLDLHGSIHSTVGIRAHSGRRQTTHGKLALVLQCTRAALRPLRFSSAPPNSSQYHNMLPTASSLACPAQLCSSNYGAPAPSDKHRWPRTV